VDVQASTKEHEHDAEFAATAYNEILEFAHGKDDHDQVENDVDASRCPCQRVQVEAFAVMFAVPVVPCNVNWQALQCSRDHEPNDIQDARYDRTVYGLS
jgi:hypothetical protein